MIHTNVGEKIGIVFGVIVELGSGDECGVGGIYEVSREDVEVFSTTVTFESILDNFSRIFEGVPSSILDLERVE